MGGPVPRFEKVEPGDEQILEDREQRELDALPSRLDRKRADFSLTSLHSASASPTDQRHARPLEPALLNELGHGTSSDWLILELDRCLGGERR